MSYLTPFTGLALSRCVGGHLALHLGSPRVSQHPFIDEPVMDFDMGKVNELGRLGFPDQRTWVLECEPALMRLEAGDLEPGKAVSRGPGWRLDSSGSGGQTLPLPTSLRAPQA